MHPPEQNWAEKFIPAPPAPRFTIASVDGPEHVRIFVGGQCVFTGDYRQGIKQMHADGRLDPGDFYLLHCGGKELVMRALSQEQRTAGMIPRVITRPIEENDHAD